MSKLRNYANINHVSFAEFDCFAEIHSAGRNWQYINGNVPFTNETMSMNIRSSLTREFLPFFLGILSVRS